MGNYWSTETTENTQNVTPKRVYGWKKDKECDRDVFHDFVLHQSSDSIKKVDLRDKCPKIYNQGKLGSCTANAIAAAYEFDEMFEGEENIFCPSRLFIYYNERKMEGTINEDNGAEIRDGIKTINTVGVCPEALWPYDITKFAEEPSTECYDEAVHHKCVEYKRVYQSLEQIKQCLIEGFPIIFGIAVYESFESEEVDKTGMVPMPKENEKLIGGHAILCVGFDEDRGVVYFRNSWGEEWGENGYGFLPIDYILNPELASDFWTLYRVNDTIASKF